jgi:hypothetical protein
MKLYSFLIFFLANAAFAETVKCKVTAAKENTMLTPYVGGTVLISLSDGSSRFFQEALSPLAMITAEQVSSWRAPRSACNYAPETIRYSDGSLRAMRFHFYDCVHRLPEQNLIGYVRADIGFDLTSRSGKYREIFLTPSGPVPSAFAELEACVFF